MGITYRNFDNILTGIMYTDMHFYCATVTKTEAMQKYWVNKFKKEIDPMSLYACNISKRHIKYQAGGFCLNLYFHCYTNAEHFERGYRPRNIFIDESLVIDSLANKSDALEMIMAKSILCDTPYVFTNDYQLIPLKRYLKK